jgi:hypothetical protein
MAVSVEKMPRRYVTCECGARLSYGPGDERPAGVGYDARAGGVSLKWPSIECPVCKRSLVVSGCW